MSNGYLRKIGVEILENSLGKYKSPLIVAQAAQPAVSRIA